MLNGLLTLLEDAYSLYYKNQVVIFLLGIGFGDGLSAITLSVWLRHTLSYESPFLLNRSIWLIGSNGYMFSGILSLTGFLVVYSQLFLRLDDISISEIGGGELHIPRLSAWLTGAGLIGFSILSLNLSNNPTELVSNLYVQMYLLSGTILLVPVSKLFSEVVPSKFFSDQVSFVRFLNSFTALYLIIAAVMSYLVLTGETRFPRNYAGFFGLMALGTAIAFYNTTIGHLQESNTALPTFGAKVYLWEFPVSKPMMNARRLLRDSLWLSFLSGLSVGVAIIASMTTWYVTLPSEDTAYDFLVVTANGGVLGGLLFLLPSVFLLYLCIRPLSINNMLWELLRTTNK